MNTSNEWIEYVTIAISVIALIISIISFLKTRRAHRTDLENTYFTLNFKEGLNIGIPRARKKLYFEDERLKGTEDLFKMLSSMRKRSDYFKYADPKFHERFKKKSQELEDYIADGMNKVFDNDRQPEFFRECDKYIRSLYKVITKRNYGA